MAKKRPSKAQRRKAKLAKRPKPETFESRFNRQRRKARNKIRQDYRDRGMPEEKVLELMPPSDDNAF